MADVFIPVSIEDSIIFRLFFTFPYNSITVKRTTKHLQKQSLNFYIQSMQAWTRCTHSLPVDYIISFNSLILFFSFIFFFSTFLSLGPSPYPLFFNFPKDPPHQAEGQLVQRIDIIPQSELKQNKHGPLTEN